MTPPALPRDAHADVVVLGAGLTGWATALELARGGAKVMVLESERVASAKNDIGHLPVGLGVPYAQAVRRLGRDGAQEVWSTHREGQDRLRELLASLAVDCACRQAGGFLLAKDRADASALAESEDLLRDDGFGGEFLDHYMLESRFSVTGFPGAYWAADEGEVDSSCLLRTLAGAALEGGAVFFEESPVLELDLTAGEARVETARGGVRAPWAVVAVDTEAARLLPFLKGQVVAEEAQILSLEIEPAIVLPSPARMCEGSAAWRQDPDGLRLALFGPLSSEGERALTDKLRARLPPRTRTPATFDASPDHFPRIGLLPGLPAAVAAGYRGLEYAYALLAAQWMAEAIRMGRDPTPLRFRADRVGGI